MEKMRWPATAYVCLHNMIVERRKKKYESDGSGGYSGKFKETEKWSDIVFESMPRSDGEDAILLLCLPSGYSTSGDGKLKGLHRNLTEALVNHIWDHHESQS